MKVENNSKPVLLIGGKSPELIAVAKALDQAKVPLVHFAPDEPLELRLNSGEVSWECKSFAYSFRAGERPRPFRSVYVGNIGLPLSHPADSEYWTAENIRRKSFYDNEIIALKLAFVQHLAALNIPMYNPVGKSVLSKPLQLIGMMMEGIPFPPTAITQNPETVQRLVAEEGKAIYKPVAGGADVNQLSDEDLTPERRKLLNRAPVIFQKAIPGKDVRVYVCDDYVIGAVVTLSPKEIDSRNMTLDAQKFPVSSSLETYCIKLVQRLGFRFCSIDLRISEDGKFEFLECNNGPAFRSTEELSGLPISKVLATRLEQC